MELTHPTILLDELHKNTLKHLITIDERQLSVVEWLFSVGEWIIYINKLKNKIPVYRKNKKDIV